MEITVEDDGHIDFSYLDPDKHAGVLLDGLGDLLLLKRNRETLQGRPTVMKGGRSQTMRYAYPFTLARRGVVVTMDLSAANIHLLDCEHWLSNISNVRVLRLLAKPRGHRAVHAEAPDQLMHRWTTEDVVRFLAASDLGGPVRTMVANGVRGRDLMSLPHEELIDDLKLLRFVAGRVLQARDAFLAPAVDD